MQLPEDTHGSEVVKRDPAALGRLQEGESGGGNGTQPSFTDFGGLLLTGVQVHLIFWGTAWSTTPPPSPSSDAIQQAVKTTLAGPYLANLYQYRRICYGTFDGSTVSSSTDPSNPFTNDDVTQFLTTLFNRILLGVNYRLPLKNSSKSFGFQKRPSFSFRKLSTFQEVFPSNRGWRHLPGK